MKLTTRLASFLMLLVLLCTAQGAIAQKKPKLKGLAKEIVGVWSLEEMTFELNEAKADSTQRAQYEYMKTMFALIKEQMKGKVTFHFKADGTFENEAQEQSGSSKKIAGTWTLEGNKLKLNPADKEQADKTPESFDVKINKKLLSLAVPAENNPVMNIITTFNRTK